MPQPKNTPQDAPKTPQDAPKTPDTPTAQDVKNAPTGSKADALVDNLFAKAVALRDEKAEVIRDIDFNRKALRTLADADALSPEQVAKVDELYPPRKTKDDAPANGTAPAATPAAPASA